MTFPRIHPFLFTTGAYLTLAVGMLLSLFMGPWGLVAGLMLVIYAAGVMASFGALDYYTTDEPGAKPNWLLSLLWPATTLATWLGIDLSIKVVEEKPDLMPFSGLNWIELTQVVFTALHPSDPFPPERGAQQKYRDIAKFTYYAAAYGMPITQVCAGLRSKFDISLGEEEAAKVMGVVGCWRKLDRAKRGAAAKAAMDLRGGAGGRGADGLTPGGELVQQEATDIRMYALPDVRIVYATKDGKLSDRPFPDQQAAYVILYAPELPDIAVKGFDVKYDYTFTSHPMVSVRCFAPGAWQELLKLKRPTDTRQLDLTGVEAYEAVKAQAIKDGVWVALPMAATGSMMLA